MRKLNPPLGILGWAWGIGPETIRFAKRRAAGTVPLPWLAWRPASAEAGIEIPEAGL